MSRPFSMVFDAYSRSLTALIRAIFSRCASFTSASVAAINASQSASLAPSSGQNAVVQLGHAQRDRQPGQADRGRAPVPVLRPAITFAPPVPDQPLHTRYEEDVAHRRDLLIIWELAVEIG